MIRISAASAAVQAAMSVLQTMLRQPALSHQRAYLSTVAASDHLRLIKHLRELTGSPISDVKACLAAANWDLAQAHEALRLKGVEAAAKKSTRHAAEGLVGLYSANPHLAVAVEVNSETDFVARNALFQALVQRVTQAAAALLPSNAHHSGSMQGEGAGCSAGPAVQELDVEQTQAASSELCPGLVCCTALPQLLAQPLPGSGHTVAEEVAATVAVVRENIRVRRAYRLASSTGCLGTYLHQSAAPGLGRIAALVLLESSTPGPEPLVGAQPASPHAIHSQPASQPASLPQPASHPDASHSQPAQMRPARFSRRELGLGAGGSMEGWRSAGGLSLMAAGAVEPAGAVACRGAGGREAAVRVLAEATGAFDAAAHCATVSQASVPAVGELSSQLAMHVAGMRPSCIQHTSAQQAGGVGLTGPTAAADGAGQQDMGREGEGEAALLDQPFLLDPALSVRLVLQSLGAAAAAMLPLVDVRRQAERGGSPLHVAAFLRLQCGEGLQQL
ncbi:hypothetical protein QJQ45_000207 [Haematococcus lacustris]|nr:hypothetical protein QJQ45_000207 [Haematococcus lacustris]